MRCEISCIKSFTTKTLHSTQTRHSFCISLELDTIHRHKTFLLPLRSAFVIAQRHDWIGLTRLTALLIVYTPRHDRVTRKNSSRRIFDWIGPIQELIASIRWLAYAHTYKIHQLTRHTHGTLVIDGNHFDIRSWYC